MTSSAHRIVVGIDGSPSAWQAMDWAAGEAQLTGRSLLVAHVAPDPLTADDFATGLLADAVDRLAEDHPRVAADTVRLPGDAADRLDDLARGADLLVVGRGHRGVHELLLGSVGRRVVGHAPCPTVVVGAHSASGGRTVVVGLSDTAGGIAALRFACEEAKLRAADVLVVRSNRESAYVLGATATAFPLVVPEDWRTGGEALVARVLELLREEFPGLAISSEVTDRPAEVALCDAARDAALLVVGCRHRDESPLPRLGPRASFAIRSAPCPVAVVGHAKDAEPLEAVASQARSGP